jgi:hypothetical protein
MSTSDIHALSGAYAVDALDDIERAQFSRHLQECAECQAEVASLREAAGLLTETTSVAPSDDLRSRILGEIKTVRPLPPLTPEQPVETPAAAATTRSGRRDVRWLRGLVAAAAVVAAVGAGGVVWQPWDDDSSRTQLSAADQVLQAPDAQRLTQKINGGEATVVASKSLNKLVVMTRDLPALEQGKVYEMWLQDAAEGMLPVEGGLMTAADTTVVLDGNVANALGAGITVEPAGGSRVPTSAPIALFEFENV